MAKPKNWNTLSESRYPWERDALDYIRSQFPTHKPYKAWANFEFIADDGSINEVDLLVFTPQGFFLIEIKSNPGKLTGDAGTWTWLHEGKRKTVDNPLIATDLKAAKLRSLLNRQKAFKKKEQPPFIEPLVFCSAPGLINDLKGNARLRVCLRDREATGGSSGHPGVMAAIKRAECPGLPARPRGTHDTPMMKAVSLSMDQAGIRASQRMRKVGDYLLDQLIAEGPGYQDWSANHTQLAESRRRIRLYLVRTEASAEDRDTMQRAALREFQLLETLEHRGILRAYNLTEHEIGPALLFEHDPACIRLDHFLAQQSDRLPVELQINLIRQIAEVIRYAHEKKVVHRGLSPQSILVVDPASERPRIKVFNWQIGYRGATSSTSVSREVTATSHVDRLVEDAATAYMAPEAFNESGAGEHLDIFSLGTVAYHIFSGSPPAANAVELSAKLRETTGLQISSVLNGAAEWLQELVRYATHPVVPERMDTIADFLGILDEVERELTTSDHDYIDDPPQAREGDLLPGGFAVVRRLGEGACSVALLVERDGQDYVLKVANDPENNARVQEEAELLGKQEMRHSCIVDVVEPLELGRHRGFLMRPVYTTKETRTIETLGQRLRKEGRLHVDLLQRFGEDLLMVVNHLEEQGVPHRDIKPDNIAVGMVGRGDKLHLVLFDFSLSRMPADNIRAGTTGYLDPLLPLRKPPRWDLYADRYSAAMSLYEMTTGTMAKWGDGSTDPSHLAPGTEITIDAELFDPALREPFVEFFTQAFRRDISQRFDNAEEMLREWRDCFAGIDQPGSLSDHADDELLRELLAEATFDTHIHELGLGTRATNALDRANILTVEDLLTVSLRVLSRLRGVGNKTRREIAAVVKILRERLGKPQREQLLVPEVPQEEANAVDTASLSVDLLADRLLKTGTRDGETFQRAVPLLLGMDTTLTGWPSQTEVARAAEVTRARIGQIVSKLQERWAKEAAISRLRSDLVEVISGQGGVMSPRELCEAVLVARGSSHDDPLRTQLAMAVVRAATEVERTMSEPRFLVRRDKQHVAIARTADFASYARRLGDEADRIAGDDPLLAPARVIERLRETPAPAGAAISDARLVRLAAEFSEHAAVSSRQELYPRDMANKRALKLSHGALLGTDKQGKPRVLTVEQIHERVAGRYPEAQPLPGRPALDAMLLELGIDFCWDDTLNDGRGGYRSTVAGLDVSSRSESYQRLPTDSGESPSGEITPEEADARQFEERLQRAIKEGAFQALLVNPRDYANAQHELVRRFPLELIDFEGLFLDALQATAGSAKVNWDLVLQTDSQPRQGDWDRLMMLVARAMPAIEERLLAAPRTVLLTYAGLLARYEQMDLLSRLSQQIGRPGGIPGLWLLLPGGNQAMIDGKPVPLIGPGQRTQVPKSWLENRHRAGRETQT